LPKDLGLPYLTVGRPYYFECYVSLSNASNLSAAIQVYCVNSVTDISYPGGPAPSFTAPVITTAGSWTKIAGCISPTVTNSHEVVLKIDPTISSYTPMTPSGAAPYPWPGPLLNHPDYYAYYYTENWTMRLLADAGPDVNYTSCSSPLMIGTNCTAIAGATYSWAAGNTLATTSAVIVNPSSPYTQIYCSATGTYIFALTVTFGGCSYTDYVTVTNSISLPLVLASASPSSIVLGASSNLSVTPTSGVTYSWSPSSTLSSSTIYNPVATPPTTTTYTVTVTASGCTITSTVTVTVTHPECGISTTTITNGAASTSFPSGIATGNYTIVGTFTIDQTLTYFSGCNFIMTPHSKINVTNGHTLIVNGQTHIYSCDSLWDGIYVLSGAGIQITDNPIIEDATSAINIAQGAATTSFVSDAIFNKNLTAINMTANTSGSTPLTITNCVFTCRYIPTYAAVSSNPTTSSIMTNLNLASPTIPVSNLFPPYSSQKGYSGVTATDVTTLAVGAVGTTTKNIFDAILIGINITNPTKNTTSATIYNNTFQYLLGYDGGCCSNGYGVWATAAVASPANTITIGGTLTNQPNTFKNCYTGIYVNSYKTITIKGNGITNTSTGPFTGYPSFMIGYGNTGINVQPIGSNTINISNQTLIKNCATGIYVTEPGSTGINSTSLTIDNNGTTGSPCITSDGTATAYCTKGIYVSDLTAGSTVAPTTWEIKNNFITKAGTCINLLNVKKPTGTTIPLSIASNSCQARYNSTSGINTNGIMTQGCSGLSITLNHTKYDVNTGSLSGGNLSTYGIYIQTSTNMIVSCNQMDDPAMCLVFQGACSSPTASGYGITQNTMTNGQDGFVLLSTGVIGTQGNATGPVASNNYWGATTAFIDGQTLTKITGANANSKLYMNTASTLPTANSTSVGDAYRTGGAGPGLNAVTGGTPTACGSVPALIAHHSNTRDMVTIDSTYTNDLINLEEDTSILPVYSDASHWQRKNYVYKYPSA
jgi:hypothetical protein